MVESLPEWQTSFRPESEKIMLTCKDVATAIGRRQRVTHRAVDGAASRSDSIS